MAGKGNDYQTIATHPTSGAAVRSAVRLKFGPQTHALQNRQKAIPGWYQNYLNTVQQSRDATANAYANANAAIQGQTNAGANVASQLSGADLSAAQSDAALRGGQADPAAAQRAAQAAAVNQGIGNSFAGATALQGANEQSRFDQLKAIGVGDEVVQQNHLRDALNELRGQKGDYAVSYLQDALAAQQKAELERLVFQGTQDYHAGQLGNERARINNSAGEADARLGVAQQNADANTYRAHHPRSGSSGGGLTAPQRRALTKDNAGQHDLLQQAIDAGYGIAQHTSVAPGDTNALRTAIGEELLAGHYGDQKLDVLGQPVPNAFSGKPVPHYIVSAALDYILNPDHHVDISHRRGLRQHGMYDTGQYRPKPKRGAGGRGN